MVTMVTKGTKLLHLNENKGHCMDRIPKESVENLLLYQMHVYMSFLEQKCNTCYPRKFRGFIWAWRQTCLCLSELPLLHKLAQIPMCMHRMESLYPDSHACPYSQTASKYQDFSYQGDMTGLCFHSTN